MVRLQYLTLLVVFSILGFNNIKGVPANATDNYQKLQPIVIAQNSSGSDDEMLDALQKRQEKLENLKELKQIQDVLAQDKLNREKLEELKKQNII